MGVESFDEYREQMALPLYLKIGSEDHNHYEIGEEYYIRVREEEEEHYVHKAVCVAGSTANNLEEIPGYVIAMATETSSMEEAKEKLSKYLEGEGKLYVVVFMREDVAEQFVKDGLRGIPSNLNKGTEWLASSDDAVKVERGENTAVAKQEYDS